MKKSNCNNGPRKRKIKIAHVITGLSVGGAEMMLYKLLSKTDTDIFDSAVISLRDEGKLGGSIESLGIPVYTLNIKPPGLPGLYSYKKLKAVLNLFQPDVVQGWMYHGNLISILAGRLTNAQIVWNVRQTLYNFANEKFFSKIVIWLNARFSSWPDKIIYNSNVALMQHEKFGFKHSKSVMIANGFDAKLFKPDSIARESVRDEFGVGDQAILIGLIGRYHPMKDHANFLTAIAELNKYVGNVVCILIGKDIDGTNKELTLQIELLNLQEKVILAGERKDMHSINAALDIAVSSSSCIEGFSNSIGEAMACGVPCVVTDIGDTPSVVGESGLVVKPADPKEMCNALLKLIRSAPEDRRKLGEMARKKIEGKYSIEAISFQYNKLYIDLVNDSIN